MILDFKENESLKIINQYKKSSGIGLVNKYLPHINPCEQIYMIESVEDWYKVRDNFKSDFLTIRADSKVADNLAKCPHALSSTKDNIPEYIKKAKEKVGEVAFVCMDLKHGSNERINTGGAFLLSGKIGDYLYIDYIGRGFDGRELNKGKATHESWNIPWEEVPFMKESSITRYKVFEITHREYVETAKERMKWQITQYPERKEEILSNMPKKYIKLNPTLFRELREQIIFPLWIRKKELLKDGLNTFCVECSVTKDGVLIPFEISRPERFKMEKKEHDER